MKKIMSLSLILIFLIQAQDGQAQLKGFSFGPYIELAKPKGDFADRNANGIGAGLAADIKLGSKFSATGSFGYLRFGRKGGLLDDKNEVISATPIRAGVKYKLPLVYLKMESGIARIARQDRSPLILSPGIGFRILGLDIQGSYETWLGEEGSSFASFRLAYHF